LAFFIDAAYNGCNPSIALQTGSRLGNAFTTLQTANIIAALDQGWIVSVADDGGPQAAFPSGLQAGQATLDSLRAVKQSGNITGVDADPIITLTGYSGGGLTSEWTAGLQPTYAPDVNIVGIALGGLVPNISASTEYVNGRLFSSLGPPGIVGLSHDYQNLSTWLDENLVPSTKAKFMRAGSQCH